jgi:hypothetical protein
MTSPLRLAAASLLGLAALAHHGRPADACSYPIGYQSRVTVPQDGALYVPTNARIVVTYRTAIDQPAVADHLQLVDAGGAPVPFTVATTVQPDGIVEVVTPSQPLAAGAQYKLLDRLPSECDLPYQRDCLAEVASPITTFTTSDGPDTTAPTFAGITDSNDDYHFFDPQDSCGAAAWIRHSLDWGAATDSADGVATETAWIRFNVYDGAGHLLHALAEGPPVELKTLCTDADGNPIAHDADGDGVEDNDTKLVVRAVDLAGNEDDNEVVFEASACNSIPDEEPGGCDASGGAAGGALGAMPILIAGIALRGRRRRGPARGR